LGAKERKKGKRGIVQGRKAEKQLDCTRKKGALQLGGSLHSLPFGESGGKKLREWIRVPTGGSKYLLV